MGPARPLPDDSLTVALGLGLPAPAWLAVAWLTPALAGVSLTLALAPYVGTSTTAAVIGGTWSVAVLTANRLGDPVEVVEPLMQLLLAAVALAALAAVLLRHSTLDLLGRHS